MRLSPCFKCSYVMSLSLVVLLLGCGKETKMLQSAENLFQQGEYKQANQFCQQIVKGNPKPEVLSRAKTLLTESEAGMGYAEVIEQLKQDKMSALSKVEELKAKYSATSFTGRFDSVYNATKSFLLENDPSYIFKIAQSLSVDKNYDEAIKLLDIINSKFSNTEWKSKAQSELASVKTLKAENDKEMAEQQKKQEQENAQKSGKGNYAGLKFGMSETQVIGKFSGNGIYQYQRGNVGQGITKVIFGGTLETMRGAQYTLCWFCDKQLFEIQILWPEHQEDDISTSLCYEIRDIIEEKYGSPDDKSITGDDVKWNGSDGFRILLHRNALHAGDTDVKLHFINTAYDNCSDRKEAGGF